MKLNKLIEKLTRASDDYFMKHGFRPSIYEMDKDEGILLCKTVKRDGCLATAKKPYKRVRIKELERLL